MNETTSTRLLSLVNRCFRSRSARAFGVFVLLAAWFAVSNHCALLAMQADGSAQHSGGAQHQCCPSQTPGDHGQPASPRGVCCKSLRTAPLESVAKLVNVAKEHELFDLVWESLREMVRPNGSETARVEATGPPRAVSFAEAVLQRSLRSHAPPFLS